MLDRKESTEISLKTLDGVVEAIDKIIEQKPDATAKDVRAAIVVAKKISARFAQMLDEGLMDELIEALDD